MWADVLCLQSCTGGQPCQELKIFLLRMQPGWLLSPCWSFPSSALSWKRSRGRTYFAPVSIFNPISWVLTLAVQWISFWIFVCVMTWISASSWSIVWWHEYRHPLGAYRLRHGQQCWHFRSRGVAVLTCRLWRNDVFSCTKNTLGKCWAEFLLRCMTTSTVHACFLTDCGRAGLLSDCIKFLLIWDFLVVPFSTFMNLAELNSLVESQVSFFTQLLSQSIWWHSANYSVTNERVFQSPIFTSPILIKFWTGSDTSWNLVLNLCGSMITLVSGLHSSRDTFPTFGSLNDVTIFVPHLSSICERFRFFSGILAC